jgi:tetratricopeptide (TPR) repeat protein
MIQNSGNAGVDGDLPVILPVLKTGQPSFFSFLFLTLFLILTFFPSLSFADRLSRKNTKGNKLYEQEKYSDAAKEYLDAQLESPKSAELNYNLGSANFKLKKYDKAFECYQKAAQTPNRPLEQKVQFNMGNTLYKWGEQEIGEGKQEGMQRWTQAIDSYKKALDMNPDDKDAKYNLEYVRRKIKEMSKREPQDQKQQQKQKQKEQPQKQDQQKQDQKQKPDSTKQQQEQQQKPKPGEMNKEQAQRLLDAFKDQEKDMQKKKAVQPSQRMTIDKDW